MKLLDHPEVLSHDKVGELYIMEVLVGHDEEAQAAVVRVFKWGLVPRATAETAPDAYSGIHDRHLSPGAPVVTEEEYRYLQMCEARDILSLELGRPIELKFQET